MEPGDLRINQQLGNERGHSRDSKLSSRQRSIYEHKSITGVIQPFQIDRSLGSVRENQNRFSISAHPSTSSPSSSLVPSRLQSVKVWRDPHLIASTEIRHVDSPQHHTNFMAHHHSGNSGPGGPPPGLNSPFLNSLSSQAVTIMSADAGLLATVPSISSIPNQGSNHQARTPGHYVPSKVNDSVWRPRYSTPAPMSSSNFPALPPESYNIARDFRTDREQDVRDKRNDSKKATDQAVQQHFDESFRLAEQKRWQQGKFEDEQHARIQPNIPAGSSGIMSMDKPYFGVPPPLESKMSDSKPIFSKAEVPIPRAREPTSLIQGRDPERNYFVSSGSHAKTGPSYNYGAATLSRAKVSSPAPPQIYGKPDARISASNNVPSSRHFDPSESAPLPLTSKVSTRARETPPLASSLSTSLPQHEVRSADLTSFYMYSMPSAGPGGNFRMGSSSPSTPQIPKLEFQTQPLDLGGKRKPDYETLPPQNLDPKKIKNEEPPLDLKAGDRVMNLSNYGIEKAVALVAESNNLNGSSLKGIGTITSVPIAPIISIESKIVSSHTPIASVSAPAVAPFNLSASPRTTQASPALVSKPISATLSQPSLVVHSTPPPPQCQGSVITVSSQNSLAAESGATSNSLDSNPPESSIISTNSVGSVNNNNNTSSPQKGTTKQIHKLKKAWLARHSGEDVVTSGDSSLKSRSVSPTSKSAVTISKGGTGYSKGVTGSDKPSSLSLNNANGQVNSIQSARGGKKGKSRRRAEPNDEGSKILNGRGDASNDKSNYSSESDEEDEKQSPKRKPPSGKRRNGKEKKKDSSPIDSASESEKDSDSGESSTKGKDPSNSLSSTPNQGNSGGRKRGRKPREPSGTSPKNDRKKSNPFKRKSIHVLKRTLESFLQDGSCNEVAGKLAKCRECRWNPSTRSKKQTHPFCRFYAFRKLRYTKNGILAIAGFSNPTTDATEEDKSLWLPSQNNLPKCLELDMSRTLISQLGDQFCELIHHEREAIEMNQNIETKTTAAWKRVVPGVRDMCDVCETTLFNFHWACGKCGFVVCIACYQSRHSESVKHLSDPALRDKERDKYQWLFCSNRQAHELDKLMLTQAIAGDSLNELGRNLHQMRSVWKIEQHCECSEARQLGSVKTQEQNKGEANGTLKTAEAGSSSSDDSDGEGADNSTLRNLLGRFNSSNDENKPENGKDGGLTTPSGQKNQTGNEEGSGKDGQEEETHSLKHFVRVNGSSSYHRKLLPIRVWTLSESQDRYPTLPHSWLCAGRLLRLEDPTNALNVKLFQDMWKRGQPVLVGNVDTRLNKSLWTPESFSKDFSELKSDLVNCISGKTVANQSIKKFWDGFDNVKKRLPDNEGNPMLLKLKDWPPGEDFAELLPERFRDLMAALPLSDYTDRNGRLNLAARLPSNFVKPDLGPKMYIAYGSGLHLDKGTTNLHLDISDAVNVMVHVGVPKDVDNTDHLDAVREAIKDSDCDTLTIQKVIEKVERAGALWHIYNSRDADKIRDLLNLVAMERGDRLEPNHDPIHDQSWYLDRPLRKRLMEEYDVSGYPIVQCLGDAVFIPAGAPHQVRNLNNCIKIAEDFVSPENVSHCFDLTEEFRKLSDTHQNHEDKLQIKNIIYHAVKDAISVLMYGHPGESSEEPSKTALISKSNSISSE